MSNNIQNPNEFSASFVNTKEIAKELLGRLGNVDNYNPVYAFLRWLADTSQDHTVFPSYFEQDHLDDVWSIWRQFQKNLESQTTTAKLKSLFPDAKDEVIKNLSKSFVKSRTPEAKYAVTKEAELALTYIKIHELEHKVVYQETVIKEQIRIIAALDSQLRLLESNNDKSASDKTTDFRRELGNLKTIIADINATVQRQDARITELEQNATPVTIKAKETNVTDVSIRQAIVRVLTKYRRLHHSLLKQEVYSFINCDLANYDRAVSDLCRNGEIVTDLFNTYIIDPAEAKRMLTVVNNVFINNGPRIKMSELCAKVEKRSTTPLDFVEAYVSAFILKGLIANVNKESSRNTDLSFMEIADQEKINKLIA